MPFKQLTIFVNSNILDYLGKCPSYYTLQCVSRNSLKVITLYNTTCQNELRSLIPNIQIVWKKLSELERFRLQSPLILKRLHAESTGQARINIYKEVLLDCSFDLSGFSKFQRYAVRLGLTPYQATTKHLCGRHLFAISFRQLSYEQVIPLHGKQIDAAIEGYDPQALIGLTPIQIEGIKRGLTRDKVFNDWFSQSHIDAIDRNIQYDVIAKLKDFQVEGILLNLSRDQVIKPWFTKRHIAAIKKGFTYQDIENRSADVAPKAMRLRALDKLKQIGADQSCHHQYYVAYDRLAGLGGYDNYTKLHVQDAADSFIKEDDWYNGSSLEYFENLWKDRLEVLHFTAGFDLEKAAKTLKELKAEAEAELEMAKWEDSLALVPNMLPQFGSIKPIVDKSTEIVAADPLKNKGL